MRKRSESPLWVRRMGVLALDAFLIAAALALSFWLRFDAAVPKTAMAALYVSLAVACGEKLVIFYLFRLDRLSWKHIGTREVSLIAAATAAGSAALALTLFLLRSFHLLAWFPRSILAIDLALTFLAVAGVRFSRRLLDELTGEGDGHLVAIDTILQASVHRAPPRNVECSM